MTIIFKKMPNKAPKFAGFAGGTSKPLRGFSAP